MMMIYPFYQTSNRIIPVKIEKRIDVIEQNLIQLGAPEKHRKEIARAIRMASRQTGISHELITALMLTESSFKPDAKSCLNYHGLMQIPYDVKFIDANVLIGTRILQEHIRMSKGDLNKAIITYKGWKVTDEKGIYNAKKVMDLKKKMEVNSWTL
jgi:soluble lytic murein transglycosylase-like protein